MTKEMQDLQIEVNRLQGMYLSNPKDLSLLRQIESNQTSLNALIKAAEIEKGNLRLCIFVKGIGFKGKPLGTYYLETPFTDNGQAGTDLFQAEAEAFYSKFSKGNVLSYYENAPKTPNP